MLCLKWRVRVRVVAEDAGAVAIAANGSGGSVGRLCCGKAEVADSTRHTIIIIALNKLELSTAIYVADIEAAAMAINDLEHVRCRR